MTDAHHAALCSGGADSIAATHAAMTFGPAEEVVFADTTTAPDDCYSAIDAAIDWLRDWCDSNGWPFTVTRPDDTYADHVAEQGYPSPREHYIQYRKWKDRAFDAYQQQFDADVHFWTGIRKWESETRMEVADPKGERGSGRWYWRAPLVEFTDARLTDYLERFDLTLPPVVKEIGRSVDCWCGCFGDPNELLDLRAAGFEEHADWLAGLMTPPSDTRERDQWAGWNWEKHDFAAHDEMQTTLCSSCSQSYPGSGGEP